MRIIASRGQRNWKDKIEGKYVEEESEEADLAENNNKGKKTQQNKQKHNKNVERGSEVDMAKKHNKTKQEKRAKMLKERVKR